MKKTLLSLPILALALSAHPAKAETRIETVLGTITSVTPLTTNIVRETPKTERICTEEKVPIYAKGSNDGELGGLIIGGLIGSAVGNKLSDSNGAGAAGAVAGALLGREQSKKNKGKIVGYEQQTVCSENQILVSETIERVTGYRLKIEADDRILQVEVPDNRKVGERVELRKEISYSLR